MAHFLFIYFLIMYMCLHVDFGILMQCLWSPEHDVLFLRAGVTGDCELLDVVGAGNESLTFGRSIKNQAFSPDSAIVFL